MSFSVHDGERHMTPVCLIISDVYFDHLVEVAPASVNLCFSLCN